MNLEKLAATLDGAIMTAERIPPLQVTIGDWRPKPGECHANCARWVAEHPADRIVRGWLDHGKFFAHSVIKREDGSLMDITPLNGALAGTILPFLRHRGSDAEFMGLVAAGINEIHRLADMPALADFSQNFGNIGLPAGESAPGGSSF